MLHGIEFGNAGSQGPRSWMSGRPIISIKICWTGEPTYFGRLLPLKHQVLLGKGPCMPWQALTVRSTTLTRPVLGFIPSGMVAAGCVRLFRRSSTTTHVIPALNAQMVRRGRCLVNSASSSSLGSKPAGLGPVPKRCKCHTTGLEKTERCM